MCSNHVRLLCFLQIKAQGLGTADQKGEMGNI